jgi:hypothetical protein
MKQKLSKEKEQVRRVENQQLVDLLLALKKRLKNRREQAAEI